jgi:hypothetical protein
MIKFFVPKGKFDRASCRFRAGIPLKGMRKEDGYISETSMATKDDLVVLAKKVNLFDLDNLKAKGVKFIFDICDDKFGQHGEVWFRACKEANLITTTCELLKNRIKETTGKTAHIIPDPTEREKGEPIFNPGDHLNLCWYGGRKSFSLFNWDEVISDIESVTKNYTIHAVTAKPEKASKRIHHILNTKKIIMYDWSFEKQGQMVKDCDIVLIPLPKGMPLVKVKSPNRLVDGLQQGRFVIAHKGIESYEQFKDFVCLGDIKDGLKWALNNKEEVIEKIKRGQQYIEQYHSAEEIGRRWIEMEKLV